MSKTAIVAGVLLLTSAAALPALAQDATPAAPAPETVAPATMDESTGPSHRLTGPAVVFNLIDGDRNGAISMEEASVLFETFFITLDRDDDGELSKDEINAALAQFHGRGGGDRDRGRDRDNRRGGGHHGGDYRGNR